RKGSSTAFMGPEPVLECCNSNLTLMVKNETEKQHQTLWSDLDACRQAMELLEGCNAKTTKYVLSLGRSDLRKLIGFLTGHNRLRHHMHRMSLADSPACSGCDNAPETAKHVLCWCPALKNARRKRLGDYYLTPEELRQSKLSNILLFIKGIGWIDLQTDVRRTCGWAQRAQQK